MNKANLAEWNLVPLCRPCRLMVQARVDWEQGRFFPVEDWLIPYRVTYLATQGISEPWLGALGGLEPSHSNSLERRLEIDAPSPSDIPINGDLGLHGSLRRLMGRATHARRRPSTPQAAQLPGCSARVGGCPLGARSRLSLSALRKAPLACRHPGH